MTSEPSFADLIDFTAAVAVARGAPFTVSPLRRVDQMQTVSVKPQPASTHIVTNIVTDTEAIGCASRRLGEGRNSCVMSCLK